MLLLRVLRWSAQTTGLVVALGYGLLLIGEFVSPHSGPPSTLTAWLGIGLLTGSVTAALLAWRWELWGGVVSLLALAAFALLVRLNNAGVAVVAAVPGVLFIICGLVRRHQVSAGS